MTQQQEHKTVFISYRRNVVSFIARAIFMDLREHGYDVFMDVESIDSGQFERIILNQIEARAHFLIILTPGTVEPFRNLDDWLLKQIHHALETQRHIIPLVTTGIELKPLYRYQQIGLEKFAEYETLHISYGTLAEALESLRREFLTRPFFGDIRPIPDYDQSDFQRLTEQLATVAHPTARELRAEEYMSAALQAHVPSKFISDFDDFDDFTPEEALYLAEGFKKASEAAIFIYNRAIRLNPSYAYAYFSRAHIRRQIGDMAGVRADLDEAIRIDPQYAEAYWSRAHLHTDINSQIADYSTYLELSNARRSEAYSARAESKKMVGDYKGALADYDELIKLNPHALNYEMRALIRHQLGDFDGAIADHTEIIRQRPNDFPAIGNRGNAHLAKGDFESAIADFTEAIRRAPQLFVFYSGRGTAFYQKGDLDSALTDFNRTIELYPQDGRAFNMRGRISLDRGNFEDAQRDFEAALRINSRDANSRLMLGNVWQKKGDFAAAVEQYQKYLNDGGGAEYNNQSEVEAEIRNLQTRLKSQ